jgi:hypothetical protein
MTTFQDAIDAIVEVWGVGDDDAHYLSPFWADEILAMPEMQAIKLLLYGYAAEWQLNSHALPTKERMGADMRYRLAKLQLSDSPSANVIEWVLS